MKKILLFLFIFIQISVYGQRSLLIGEYEKTLEPFYDTTKYIFLSLDSVKEVNTVNRANPRNISIQVKNGSWQITKIGIYGHFYVTLKFSDGSQEDVVFYPCKIRSNTNYYLYLNGKAFTSFWGKNGITPELEYQIKARKAGL